MSNKIPVQCSVVSPLKGYYLERLWDVGPILVCRGINKTKLCWWFRDVLRVTLLVYKQLWTKLRKTLRGTMQWHRSEIWLWLSKTRTGSSNKKVWNICIWCWSLLVHISHLLCSPFFPLATRPVAKALAGQQGLRHKIKSFGNFPFLSAKLCKCSRIKYFDSPFFLVNNVLLKIEKNNMYIMMECDVYPCRTAESIKRNIIMCNEET